MAQRNDDELAFYLADLVRTAGHINDQERDWYLSKLAPYTGAMHINDIWQAYWLSLGIAQGTPNDMAYAWLVSLGIPAGHINDMWHEYLDTGLVGVLKMLKVTGQTTIYAAGDDGDLQIGAPNSWTILTTGQYAGTTIVTVEGKTESLSNNCVIDNTNDLMWTRERPNEIGFNNDGGLYWIDPNTNQETIFEYAVQANISLVANYSDWRVPNRKELKSLLITGLPAPFYDTTVFPNIEPLSSLWTSSTYPLDTANGIVIHFSSSMPGFKPKNSAPIPTLLVRN